MGWNLTLTDQLFMLVRILYDFLLAYAFPAVCTDLVDMHIGENVGFIATSIDVELIEISHERMVCTR